MHTHFRFSEAVCTVASNAKMHVRYSSHRLNLVSLIILAIYRAIRAMPGSKWLEPYNDFCLHTNALTKSTSGNNNVTFLVVNWSACSLAFRLHACHILLINQYEAHASCYRNISKAFL